MVWAHPGSAVPYMIPSLMLSYLHAPLAVYAAVNPLSALDTSRSALSESFYLFKCRHGGVAREGREQRSMSPTESQSILRTLSTEKPMDQPCGESITSTDTIVDIQ